jgi:hypothetical protein
MQDHYNFSDREYKKLLKDGVTVKLLYKLAEVFSPFDKYIPPSKISLYFYIDKYGDFTQRKSARDKVAYALWDRLGKKDKMEVMKYIGAAEEDFEEDE